MGNNTLAILPCWTAPCSFHLKIQHKFGMMFIDLGYHKPLLIGHGNFNQDMIKMMQTVCECPTLGSIRLWTMCSINLNVNTTADLNLRKTLEITKIVMMRKKANS